jgi:hypothetical protein
MGNLARASMVLNFVTACGFPPPPIAMSDPLDATTGQADAQSPAQNDGPGNHARCDPAKPFGTPTPVENINSSLEDQGFALTRDETTGFVLRDVTHPGQAASSSILGVRRSAATAVFSIPDADLTSAINDAVGTEFELSLSSDGLVLYFFRQTDTESGILAATRTDPGASFDAGIPVFVDGIALTNALGPMISADGQTLYWLDFLDFGKLFTATRGSGPTAFINKREAATFPLGSIVVSADELTMYYATGGNSFHVMVTTRSRKSDTFGPGTPVENVNSVASESPTALTYDGCVLYISSNRPGGMGGYDIWETHRPQ